GAGGGLEGGGAEGGGDAGQVEVPRAVEEGPVEVVRLHGAGGGVRAVVEDEGAAGGGAGLDEVEPHPRVLHPADVRHVDPEAQDSPRDQLTQRVARQLA